jgi:hypothetical protein
MGMFDNVKCLYPTPWPDASEVEWQTKDTDAQYLDDYEIRADGTLWHKEYEPRFEENPKAPLGFYIQRDNEHWVQETTFTDRLYIYGGKYRILFWFRGGTVKDAVYYEDEKEVSMP